MAEARNLYWEVLLESEMEVKDEVVYKNYVIRVLLIPLIQVLLMQREDTLLPTVETLILIHFYFCSNT